MPYIAPADRGKFRGVLKGISDNISNSGDFNYVISTLVSEYLKKAEEDEGKVSYFHINQLIGVLECAKLELYRRIAAPYEDIKVDENGDIYNG